MIDPKLRGLLLGIFCMVLVSMQACAPIALEIAGELSLAESLTVQGLLYIRQGKYSQAEPLLKRSLAIYEKVMGREHLRVANVLQYLGLLYTEQGKYAEAKPLLARAREIREKYVRQNPGN